MGKKLIWIIILIGILGGIAYGLAVSRKMEGPATSSNTIEFGKKAIENIVANEVENVVETAEESKPEESGDETYEKKIVSDGTLYSIDGNVYTADVVVDEKFYDTTINDMWLNPKSYYDKNIEIEGLYLANLPYTFVGRYSESNLCPNCPTGYSYFEYQLKSDIDAELANEEDWIKVIGTLKEGIDESTKSTYLYLDVLSLEVMNTKGNDTVTN